LFGALRRFLAVFRGHIAVLSGCCLRFLHGDVFLNGSAFFRLDIGLGYFEGFLFLAVGQDVDELVKLPDKNEGQWQNDADENARLRFEEIHHFAEVGNLCTGPYADDIGVGLAGNVFIFDIIALGNIVIDVEFGFDFDNGVGVVEPVALFIGGEIGDDVADLQVIVVVALLDDDKVPVVDIGGRGRHRIGLDRERTVSEEVGQAAAFLRCKNQHHDGRGCNEEQDDQNIRDDCKNFFQRKCPPPYL